VSYDAPPAQESRQPEAPRDTAREPSYEAAPRETAPEPSYEAPPRDTAPERSYEAAPRPERVEPDFGSSAPPERDWSPPEPSFVEERREPAQPAAADGGGEAAPVRSDERQTG